MTAKSNTQAAQDWFYTATAPAGLSWRIDPKWTLLVQAALDGRDDEILASTARRTVRIQIDDAWNALPQSLRIQPNVERAYAALIGSLPTPEPAALDGRRDPLDIEREAHDAWIKREWSHDPYACNSLDGWLARASLPAGGVVERPRLQRVGTLMKTAEGYVRAFLAPGFDRDCIDLSRDLDMYVVDPSAQGGLPEPFGYVMDGAPEGLRFVHEQPEGIAALVHSTMPVYSAHQVRALLAATPQPSETQGRRQMTDAEERQAALGKAIERAASELPDRYDLEVCVERGAGWVTLTCPVGNNIAPTFDGDHTLAEQVDGCIDAAIRHGIPASPQDGGAV